MERESTDALLARLDERTAAMAGSVERLSNEISKASDLTTKQLEAQEARLQQQMQKDRMELEARISGEVYNLREHKEQEHVELREAQERIDSHLKAVQKDVGTKIDDLSDRVRPLEEWRWRIIGAASVAAAGGGAGVAWVINLATGGS